MARIPDEDPPGAPDWIVTFSDMVSLLVTFFILLMTFSSMEQYNVFQVPESLEGTRGILTSPHGPSAVVPPAEDLMSSLHAARGSPTPHSRPPEGLPESIAEMGRRISADHLEIDLSDLADGLLVHFDERAAFPPGSTEVNGTLREMLVELGRTLQHYPHLVVVEGHADAGFAPSPLHPEAEDLALARAQAAVAVLVEHGELPAARALVASHGASQPRSSNETALGRAANRRVEVRILSLSGARQAALSGNGR